MLEQPEWDPRPTSPSSIRLIHFGKLLDDKNTLEGMALAHLLTPSLHFLPFPLLLPVSGPIRLSFLSRASPTFTNSDIECRFQQGNPNVVHMSVKPQDIVDDEENAKSGKAAGGRDRAGSESGANCRCCVIQ